MNTSLNECYSHGNIRRDELKYARNTSWLCHNDYTRLKKEAKKDRETLRKRTNTMKVLESNSDNVNRLARIQSLFFAFLFSVVDRFLIRFALINNFCNVPSKSLKVYAVGYFMYSCFFRLLISNLGNDLMDSYILMAVLWMVVNWKWDYTRLFRFDSWKYPDSNVDSDENRNALEKTVRDIIKQYNHVALMFCVFIILMHCVVYNAVDAVCGSSGNNIELRHHLYLVIVSQLTVVPIVVWKMTNEMTNSAVSIWLKNRKSHLSPLRLCIFVWHLAEIEPSFFGHFCIEKVIMYFSIMMVYEIFYQHESLFFKMIGILWLGLCCVLGFIHSHISRVWSHISQMSHTRLKRLVWGIFISVLLCTICVIIYPPFK